MKNGDKDSDKYSADWSNKKSVRIRESQDVYVSRTTGLDEEMITRAKAITEFSNLKLPVYSHQNSVSGRRLQRMRIRIYLYNMLYMLIFMAVFMIKAYVFVRRDVDTFTRWEWIGIGNVFLMVPNIVYLCRLSNTSKKKPSSIVPFANVLYNIGLTLTSIYTFVVESDIQYASQELLFLKISIYVQIGFSGLTSFLMLWIGCKIKLIERQSDNTASYFESQLD